MPVISRFDGIVIRMYFLQSEHYPPHFHAIYGGNAAAIAIETGEVLDEKLPRKILKEIEEWRNIHKDELLEIWKTQIFRLICP